MAVYLSFYCCDIRLILWDPVTYSVGFGIKRIKQLDLVNIKPIEDKFVSKPKMT